MKKILSGPILLFFTLCAHEQLLLVVVPDMNASHALMQRFELVNNRFEALQTPATVNIGRNGLGWGHSEYRFTHPQHGPQKHEGDGRAPAGVFPLISLFGYSENFPSAMPYHAMSASHICVDDDASPYYNRIVRAEQTGPLASFETMRRDDAQYELGITVAHNPQQLRGAGSCIFLHVQRETNAPTAGCTSMTLSRLSTIARWLDPEKAPLLVQIPRSACKSAESLFPGLSCP